MTQLERYCTRAGRSGADSGDITSRVIGLGGRGQRSVALDEHQSGERKQHDLRTMYHPGLTSRFGEAERTKAAIGECQALHALASIPLLPAFAHNFR